MGDFPESEAGASGEQSANSAQGSSDGTAEGSEAGEPGFGDMAGGGTGGVPDLTDEPSFEEVMAGMEDAMGQPGGASGSGTGEQSAGQQGSTEAATGIQGGGIPGLPGGMSTGGGSGPLTPAEQVAILDARLEKGTGEFDTMILQEQIEQRESTRERSKEGQIDSVVSGNGAGNGSGEGTADAGEYGGGYSTGSGMGGAGNGGGVPQDTAKYPPPKDIPSGNDDDVVARQLREAAMREPDPAVREKLWDEYRKYKGISK